MLNRWDGVILSSLVWMWAGLWAMAELRRRLENQGVPTGNVFWRIRLPPDASVIEVVLSALMWSVAVSSIVLMPLVIFLSIRALVS